MVANNFWELPGGEAIEITAPAHIVELLAQSIALVDNIPATFKTIKLNWDKPCFEQYYQHYWSNLYQEDDIVCCEDDEIWFVLGYGFILQYSKTLAAASFYIKENRIEDLLVFSYPLLNLLMYLLNARGFIPLHAAVIGNNNGFALIPGKQNTGKSTTSASWVLLGGNFLTDDLCFVHPTNPLLAFGFYPTIRLRPQSLGILNHLLTTPSLKQKNDTKFFFNVLGNNASQFIPQSKLNAIFCINLHSQQPSHVIASKKTGYEYLASSVAFAHQHKADSKLCLQTIKQLVNQLPIYKINLSPSVDDNRNYLYNLLAYL